MARVIIDLKMRYRSQSDIAEVVRAFEAATIAREDWKHPEHLTVALHYVCLYDFETATEKMRSGLLHLLASFGVDLTLEMPYRETLTVFWMQTVASYAKSRVGVSMLQKTNEIIEKYDKQYPLKFHSREYLFSDQSGPRE